MNYSKWLSMSSEQRRIELEKAKNYSLSESGLYDVFNEASLILEKELNFLPQFLSTDVGRNPDTGEHVVLIYVDASASMSVDAVPAKKIDITLIAIDLGERRRRYFEVWYKVLTALFEWSKNEIDNLPMTVRSIKASKKLMFYYRSVYFYLAQVIIDTKSKIQLIGIPRVMAIRAIENFIEKNISNIVNKDEILKFKTELQIIISEYEKQMS
jgi:hypothetical protein